MGRISVRLGQVDLSILDRLGNDLVVVLLDWEWRTRPVLIVVIVVVVVMLFLRWFKSILEAVHLTGFAFILPDHLGSCLVLCIDELLTAARIAFLNGLVIAHRWHTLVGYAAQVAALVKADLVFFCRLDQLRLVHNLSNLFLKQTVRQHTECTSLPIIWIVDRFARCAWNWGRGLLAGVLLFAVSALTGWVLLETSVLPLFSVGKKWLMRSLCIVIATIDPQRGPTFPQQFLRLLYMRSQEFERSQIARTLGDSHRLNCFVQVAFILVSWSDRLLLSWLVLQRWWFMVCLAGHSWDSQQVSLVVAMVTFDADWARVFLAWDLTRLQAVLLVENLHFLLSVLFLHLLL